MLAVVAGPRAEAASGRQVFKNVAVVSGWFALSQPEDVGQAERHRHERREKGQGEGLVQDDQQDEEHDDTRADAADEPPKETPFQTPGAAFGIGRGVGVGQAQFAFGAHGGFGRRQLGAGTACLESADTDGAVGGL